MRKKNTKNTGTDTLWLSRLAETFAEVQREAREDIAAEMREPADFFNTDPDAVDKMLAFMERKGVITVSQRDEDSLCRPQKPAMKS